MCGGPPLEDWLDRTVASSTRVLKSHAASASRDRTVASNVLARGT